MAGGAELLDLVGDHADEGGQWKALVGQVKLAAECALCRHRLRQRDGVRHNVAPMARAAVSGSAAWVIGRPITRIEAPASSAARGVTVRF